MTLQQLRYAIAVADCGSMNQAAAKLFISQASLSGKLGEMIKKIAPLLLVGGTLVFNSVSEDSRNQFEKAIDDNGLKLEQMCIRDSHYSFIVRCLNTNM